MPAIDRSLSLWSQVRKGKSPAASVAWFTKAEDQLVRLASSDEISPDLRGLLDRLEFNVLCAIFCTQSGAINLLQNSSVNHCCVSILCLFCVYSVSILCLFCVYYVSIMLVWIDWVEQVRIITPALWSITRGRIISARLKWYPILYSKGWSLY